MSAIDWTGEAFSLRLAMTLMHFLWQGCAVGAAVLVCGRLLRSRSAQLRYAVGVAGMLIMLVCLPISFMRVDVPQMPESVVSNNVVTELTIAPEVKPELEAAATELAAPVEPTVDVEHTQVASHPRESDTSPVVPQTLESARRVVTAASSAEVSRTPPNNFLTGVAPAVMWGYFGGVLLMTLRLTSGLWGEHRLRSASIPCNDPTLIAIVRDLAERLRRSMYAVRFRFRLWLESSGR